MIKVHAFVRQTFDFLILPNCCSHRDYFCERLLNKNKTDQPQFVELNQPCPEPLNTKYKASGKNKEKYNQPVLKSEQGKCICCSHKISDLF